MLPTNLINALQAQSNSGKPLIAASADAPNRAIKLEVGQQFQGSVQSKISDGLFSVKVAGQTIQMRLPNHIQSGEVLKLEVITASPKITFSMVPSTNPLSTPEQISATAQILSNLAELPIERQTVHQLGNKAVWQAEQQAPDIKLLASALREALGKSGLFYESHQVQWIRGERSTDQLLEEPQNVLTGRNLLPPTPEQQANSSLDKISAAQIQSNNSSTSKSAGEAPLSIVKELLPLVQQQLHTLEHHHLVWMGQVWPGQQMQWKIQGEQEHQTRRDNERQWSTEMELALPKLGNVVARLVFAESGLRLTLHAADSKTVNLLNRSLPQLKNSFSEADIALISTVVVKS